MSSAGRSKRIIDALAAVTGGEFEILRELGRGGMGWVFLARDLRLNRRVALKVLSPALLMEDGMGERFLREAQILASLRHANIVGVHAVHHVDDVHWFVMDFIDGPSLDQVLRSLGRLEITAVRTIAYMAGSALDYGHHRGRGVVHRDIKPGNVLLDADGSVVVTDFGISKVLTGNTRLTRTGLVVGTPEFMSPEQCAGDEQIGPASDQYSFGALLYQMLTGNPPFSGGTVEVLLGHVQKTPEPILDRRPDCPPDLAAAVERMLLKNPDERFPDIAAALEAMGAGPVGLRSERRAELASLARASVSATGAIDISSPLSPVRGVSPPGLEDAATGGVARSASGADEGSDDAPLVEHTGDTVSSLFLGSARERMRPGDSIPIWVDARDAEGRTVPQAPISLTVDRPDLATLGDGGLLVALKSGTVTVTAATGEIERQVKVEIEEEPRPARITLEPPELKLVVGASRRIAVAVLDQSGAAMDDAEVVWSADPPGVVRMDGPVAVAVGEGETRITATAGLASASLSVETRRRPAAVVVDGARDAAEVGDEFVLSPLVVDAEGIPIPGIAVRWSSSDPDVAEVDDEGRLRTRAPGVVSISATHGDLNTAFDLEVVAPPPPPPPPPPSAPLLDWERDAEVEREAEAATADLGWEVVAADPWEDEPGESEDLAPVRDAEARDDILPMPPPWAPEDRSAEEGLEEEPVEDAVVGPAAATGPALGPGGRPVLQGRRRPASSSARAPLAVGAVAVLTVAGWWVFGRGGEPPTTPAAAEPETFAVLPLAALTVGDSARAASDLPGEWAAEAEWASLDPAVATVSAAGVIRAVGEGTTAVLLRLGDREASTELRVLAPPAAEPTAVAAADAEAEAGPEGGSGAAAPRPATERAVAEPPATPPTRTADSTAATTPAAAARRDAQPAEPVTAPAADPVTPPPAETRAAPPEEETPPPAALPPGEIRIRVRPEAVTYVDDVASPDAPRSTNILSLPPGEYRIRLARPGFLPFDTVVVVVPEGVLEIRKNLQPGGAR